MRISSLNITRPIVNNSFCGNGSTGIDWGDLDGVPCPICGQPFIPKSKQKRWTEDAGKVSGNRLRDLIFDTFGKYESSSFYEKRALDQITDKIDRSRNNYQLKEYYFDVRKILKPKLINEYSIQLSNCLNYFRNLKKSGEFLPPDIINDITHFIKAQQEILNADNTTKLTLPSKKMKFLEKKVNEKCISNNEKEEYLKVIRQSGLFSEEVNSKCEDLIFWGNNKAGRSLVQRLISPYLTTSEHVYPKSKKCASSQEEINNICNYLPTHERCNTQRGDLSWQELIEKGVTTFKNINDCIRKMQSRWKDVKVTEGTKPSYQTWREGVRDMLSKDMDRYWEERKKIEKKENRKTKKRY